MQEKELEGHDPMLHMVNSIVDPDTGKPLEYRHLINHKRDDIRATWNRSGANEFGRLAQGVGGRIEGTNTIFFIHPSKIPKTRTATYARFVCDYRPQKTEKERTRITVGGNLINYPGDVSTRTADITTAKLLFNSTISDVMARFMGLDIKNYYLGTPLDRYEYMRIKWEDIPEEIRQEYNLEEILVDGWIYVEIRKGMYGLPQAGILANKLSNFVTIFVDFPRQAAPRR